MKKFFKKNSLKLEIMNCKKAILHFERNFLLNIHPPVIMKKDLQKFKIIKEMTNLIGLKNTIDFDTASELLLKKRKKH